METLGEVLYAPVWWYTRGALSALKRCRVRIHDANEYLGFTVWLRNIFVPMYGQDDMAGRLISLGMRVVQVLVRGVGLMLVAVVSVFMLLAYFILPIIVLTELTFQWILVP